MPINNNHKIIFVHITRTGGTSIERILNMKGKDNSLKLNTLYGIYKGIALQHLNISEIKKLKNVDDYFSFCVVRNPFDRIISEFKFLKSNTPNKFTKYFKKSFDKFVNEIVIAYNEGKVNKFGFNKYEYNEEDHFKTQLSYIKNNNKIDVNKILRFENLNRDWKEISNRFNLSTNLPKVNKSYHKNYRRYYNKQNRKIIEKYYKEDLDYFNYSF